MREKQIFLSKSAAQTQRLAARVLKELLKEKAPPSPPIRRIRRAGKILALAGELGSGKTTFIQGLAKALGIKRITSPSFVIMRRYGVRPSGRDWSLAKARAPKNFFHIDCYRLDKSKELVDLGFKEIIKQPKNLVVIEWADKIKSLIPKGAVWVKFEWVSPKERRIILIIPNS